MKNTFFILITITTLLSCKTEKKNIDEPSKKIEKNEFINILINVNLLEGYLTSINVNQPAIKDTSLGQYKEIFEKYNINYKQYKENYDYYIQQSYFKDMQQKLLDSLTKMEEIIMAQKEITASELKMLLLNDSADLFMIYDTILTHKQKTDTILSYYNNHQNRLKSIETDSISFVQEVVKLKENKALFNSVINKSTLSQKNN